MTTFEERFYQTPYGWFRREGMTLCAPVHVLAEPIAARGVVGHLSQPERENVSAAKGCGQTGEARESTYKNRAISGGSVGSDNCRSSDSRGGRTIICGGSVESRHTGILELSGEASRSEPRAVFGSATGLTCERRDSRSSDRPAAISGKGRW